MTIIHITLLINKFLVNKNYQITKANKNNETMNDKLIHKTYVSMLGQEL